MGPSAPLYELLNTRGGEFPLALLAGVQCAKSFERRSVPLFFKNAKSSFRTRKTDSLGKGVQSTTRFSSLVETRVACRASHGQARVLAAYRGGQASEGGVTLSSRALFPFRLATIFFNHMLTN